MATPLSRPKVFDYHAALDCVPGNHSEIEKTKILAFEISLVNPFNPMTGDHKKYIEIHFDKYQALLDHARRCFLMFQGMGYLMLSPSSELKEKMLTWVKSNQDLEVLVIPCQMISVIPPEIFKLKNLKVTDLKENPISFLPQFLNEMPNLAQVISTSKTPPKLSHTYRFEVVLESKYRAESEFPQPLFEHD